MKTIVSKSTVKGLILRVANWILNPNQRKSNAITNVLLIITKSFKCVRLRMTFLTFYLHHEYHSFTGLDIELSPRVYCPGRPWRYGIYEIKMLNGRPQQRRFNSRFP